MLRRNGIDAKGVAKNIKQSEIIVDILANRGIRAEEEMISFLNPRIEDLHDPQLMKDMDKGVGIVKSHIEAGRTIAVYGDYDVDGVMSSYILYKALLRCGANAIYYIPHRELEGYGMNSKSVEKLNDKGVNLILTCDNGISAIEQIELAKSLDMDVVVTDHHELPFEENEDGSRKEIMPCADAVVNPKRPDCNYPFDLLCAGAIAYKFARKLYREFGIDESEADAYIEYAAMATVCDVVDLVGENRIIASLGMEMLRNTENIGLNALINETGIEKSKIGTYHIGFVIGPCINATGRLEMAALAMELLLCGDKDEAQTLAKKLVYLNEERKQMTEDGVERVKSLIESSTISQDKVILALDEGIHESIAGIVAGRIKEQYHLPTIILTRGKEMLKGSGRSIEAYNMFEGLMQCKSLISKFGGHPMAAGLSMEEENVDELRRKLNELCELSFEEMERRIRIDRRLPLESVSYSIVEQIKSLEPFGKGNSAPVFAEKGIRVAGIRILGKNKNVLKLSCVFGRMRSQIDAISFDGVEKFKEIIESAMGEHEFNEIASGKKVNIAMDMVYTIGINEYMGSKKLQLLLKDFRISQ